MAYAGTVAAGRFQRARNIPGQIFISPDLLHELWSPMVAPKKSQTLVGYVSKRFDSVAKASAQHIREGLVYESRGIVANNPLHPVEISGWGQLNNLGGGGLGALNKAKTPASRGARNTKMANRNAKFDASIKELRNKILAEIEKGIGSPRPLEPIEPKNKTNKANMAAYRKKTADYNKALTAWNLRMRAFIKKPENSHLAPIPENISKYRDGHKNLILFFKRGGYFVAPKLATLELRFRPEILKIGKGEDYIELDGLIYDKASNKVIILELKKELGASGPEDAIQMRKAATLFRKWGYEITGRVPTVELYFAAGAAEHFTSNGYSFNLEKNNNTKVSRVVQNWTPRHIQTAIAARADHIVYVRTPVYLLTGIGLGDLLRIDPGKIAQIRDALTLTIRQLQMFAGFFEDKKITTPSIKPYVVKHVGGTLKDPVYAPATAADFNSSVQMYLDIGSMAVRDPEFSKLVPPHWKPKTGNNNTLPTMKLAKIAEGMLYINALKRKLAKPNLNNAKRTQLEKEYMNYHELLLSNKYANFVRENQKVKLRAELARLGVTAPRAVVASPTQNAKFYSRILKQAKQQPVAYFKRNKSSSEIAGRTKQAAASKNVKYGYSKVADSEILPNYLFKKGANVNLGNVSANNVMNANSSTITRWLGLIVTFASQPKRNATVTKSYESILNYILAHKPVTAEMKPSQAAVWTKIRKTAEMASNLLKGKAVIMNRAPAPRSNNGARRRQANNGSGSNSEEAPPKPTGTAANRAAARAAAAAARQAAAAQRAAAPPKAKPAPKGKVTKEAAARVAARQAAAAVQRAAASRLRPAPASAWLTKGTRSVRRPRTMARQRRSPARQTAANSMRQRVARQASQRGARQARNEYAQIKQRFPNTPGRIAALKARLTELGPNSNNE